jgi:hypothetical protein
METRSQSQKRVQPDTSPKSVADAEQLLKRKKAKPKKLAQKVIRSVAKGIENFEYNVEYLGQRNYEISSQKAELARLAEKTKRATKAALRASGDSDSADKYWEYANEIPFGGELVDVEIVIRAANKASKAARAAEEAEEKLAEVVVEARKQTDSSSQTESDTEEGTEEANTPKVSWSEEVDTEESGRIIPVLLKETMAAAMEVVEVAEHDPTLNKVKELQQKLAGGKTLSLHDFQVMMLEMYEKILTQKDKKIMKLEKDNSDNMVRIEKLEHEVDYLRKEKLRDDVEDAKHGVILRGIGNLGGAKEEFANDVNDFGHRLLAKLEVDGAVSVSCRRPRKKQG